MANLFEGLDAGKSTVTSRARQAVSEMPGPLQPVGRFFAGFSAASRQDPLMGPVVARTSDFLNRLVTGEEGYTTEEREFAASGKAGTVGKFVGTALPYLIPGVAAYNAGKGGLAALVAARNPKVAAYLAQRAGGEVLKKPFALRSAEALGGSAGFGAEEFVRGLAKGESIGEAAREGAQAGAITLGIESAAAGIGYGMARAGVDPTKILSRLKPGTDDTVAALEGEITAAREKVLDRVYSLRRRMAKQGKTPELLEEASRLGGSREAMELRLARLKKKWAEMPAIEHSKDVFRQTEEGLRAEAAKIGVKVQKLETEAIVAELEVGMAEGFGQPTAQLARHAGRAKIKLAEQQRLFTQKTTTAEQARAIRRGELDPAPSAYLSEAPVNATDRRLMFGMVTVPSRFVDLAQKVGIQVTKSPETMGRQLGFAPTVATESVELASYEAKRIAHHFSRRLDRHMSNLGKAMGVGVVRRTKSDDWAKPVRDAWETVAGWEAFSLRNPQAARVWQQIMRDVDDAHELALQIGAHPKYDAQTLRSVFGVDNFFPQMRSVSGEWTHEKMVKSLMNLYAGKGRPITRVKALEILGKMEQQQGQGLKRVGSLDFQREIPGTTAEKIRSKIQMVDSPREVLHRYYAGVAHRVAHGRQFGPNGELRQAFIEAAVEEGASRSLVTSLMDHYLGNKLHNQAMQEAAHFLTSWGILSKLGLAAIPNFTQPINNVLWAGLQSQGKALKAVVDKTDRDIVLSALMVKEAGLSSAREMILMGETRGALDSVVRGFLAANLFTPTEMWNRIISGATGLVVARDNVAKAIAGRLRGDNLAKARRQLNSIGLDLDKVAKRGYLTRAEEELAAYNTARFTQFIPDITKRPIFWQHPVGRVVFQFKNFAFNQTKFIRDQVFKEAAHGNIRPLAYFMTLYPAAGEFVNSTVAGIKGKQRTGNSLTRYVENMAAVGGLGLAWQAAMSMKWGDPAGFALGPTVSDAFDWMAIAVNDDRPEKAFKWLKKQPTGRYLGLLSNVAMEGAEGMDALIDAMPKPRRGGAQGSTTEEPEHITGLLGSLR